MQHNLVTLFATFLLTLAACQNATLDVSTSDGGLLTNPPDDASTTATEDAAPEDAAADDTSVLADSSQDTAPQDTATPDTRPPMDTAAPPDTAPEPDTATPDPTDPYAEARFTCVDAINMFRASNGKPPLERWGDAEFCSDEAATSDQTSGTPHGAFGMCGERGQNECLGQGTRNVVGCLQQMWDERLLDGCSGCDACADRHNPSCPDCDFYGRETGDVCGHYANMNAEYFSRVACGFSERGGWVVINFR